MRRTARTAGTIGLPFYWLILASLAVVVVPWYLLVKGIIALVRAFARAHADAPSAPAEWTDPGHEAYRRRMAAHLAGTASADLIPQARHSNRR
jgi:hypothetical protein